jgi:predicted aspartyl protease
VPAFYESGSYANHSIDFVFDTGAFITVVSRETAKRLKFLDSCTIMKDIQLDGFAGGCLADIKETPGFLIGGKFIDGAKVAVPHEDTDMNILGLNVIDYFDFLVDAKNDKIYFAGNPHPDIPDSLRCRQIRMISSEDVG